MDLATSRRSRRRPRAPAAGRPVTWSRPFSCTTPRSRGGSTSRRRRRAEMITPPGSPTRMTSGRTRAPRPRSSWSGRATGGGVGRREARRRGCRLPLVGRLRPVPPAGPGQPCCAAPRRLRLHRAGPAPGGGPRQPAQPGVPARRPPCRPAAGGPAARERPTGRRAPRHRRARSAQGGPGAGHAGGLHRDARLGAPGPSGPSPRVCCATSAARCSSASSPTSASGTCRVVSSTERVPRRLRRPRGAGGARDRGAPARPARGRLDAPVAGLARRRPARLRPRHQPVGPGGAGRSRAPGDPRAALG